MANIVRYISSSDVNSNKPLAWPEKVKENQPTPTVTDLYCDARTNPCLPDLHRKRFESFNHPRVRFLKAAEKSSPIERKWRIKGLLEEAKYKMEIE